MNGDCVEIICLPLYSESETEGKFIQPQANLNLWNASGRNRNENEVEIPLPIMFRRFFPVFFPTDSKFFELRLPNYVTLQAKIGKDGRVLNTNPSKDLGRWLLRQVLRIPAGTVITYDLLEKKGIDAIYIEKWIDGSEVFYKIFPAPVGEYEEFVKHGIKFRKEVSTYGSKPRFSSDISKTVSAAIAAACPISAGDRVRHKTFGEGLVKSVNDDMVELEFTSTTKSFKYSWLVKNNIITVLPSIG